MSNFGDRYTPDEKAVITSAANLIKEHMNPAEPKPQTPLTDAIRLTIAAGDWIKESDATDAALFHAESLELKLQETVLWIEKSNTAQYAQELELKLQEAERQRDEAKAKLKTIHKELGCELSDPNGTIWEHAAKVEAERDQLIKVVDSAYVSLEARQRYLSTEGTKQVLEAYSRLPHVRAKKSIAESRS